MKHSILVVDDEIDNVEALERLFRKHYTVLKALSADEGLEQLKKNKVSLILSDQRMPKKTGVEFLKESIQIAPDAIRILLTGYTDIESVIDAINSGEVYRYLTKPWDPVDLQNTVRQGIERFEMSGELKTKNIQLENALSELKTLDQAKTQFMMLINHELKTPLTIIFSFLELLLETPLTAEQTKAVRRILQGAERLDRLIQDVLLFISSETGQLKLNKNKLSLKEIFKNLEEKNKEALLSKKQKWSMPPLDLPIVADEKLITEAIDRLVSNAIRFGVPESTIQIQWLKMDEPEAIRVSITNEGQGLSKTAIEKIMKPFTLDEDSLKHSEGIGLGLSLCQSLLKAHDSRLHIESSKGQVTVSFFI